MATVITAVKASLWQLPPPPRCGGRGLQDRVTDSPTATPTPSAADRASGYCDAHSTLRSAGGRVDALQATPVARCALAAAAAVEAAPFQQSVS